MKQFQMTDDEERARDANRTKRKAVEHLSFDKLFVYEDMIRRDQLIDAYIFLVDNSDISETEKQLIRDWYIRKD